MYNIFCGALSTKLLLSYEITIVWCIVNSNDCSGPTSHFNYSDFYFSTYAVVFNWFVLLYTYPSMTNAHLP